MNDKTRIELTTSALLLIESVCVQVTYWTTRATTLLLLLTVLHKLFSTFHAVFIFLSSCTVYELSRDKN